MTLTKSLRTCRKLNSATLEFIDSKRPPTFKGKLIKKVVIKSTLGDAWKIQNMLIDPSSPKYHFRKIDQPNAA